MDPPRCAHPKRDGKPCPWRAQPGRAYCGTHARVIQRALERAHGKRHIPPQIAIEPWELAGIPAPPVGTSERALRLLRAALRRGPTRKDTEGSLYAYTLDRDTQQKLEYFKVGRTSRPVATRLAEWPGSVLQEAWLCSKNHKFAEKLTHLWLDKYRIYRYEYDGGHHSVRKADGVVIQDPQALSTEEFAKNRRGMHKHIEWFACTWARVERVVVAVVRAADAWKREEK